MNSIRTVDGTILNVVWIAVSNIDGALRFCVIDADVTQLFTLFTNPENCSEIVRLVDNEDMQTYSGYTVFRGIQMNYDGTAIVSLSKI